jgi:hypothetical protein
VIRGAIEAGKTIRVLAAETRPLLQGARLTAWELMEDGIETVVIADSSVGSLMRRGRVDLVVVGADRIAQNGDVANKIGTYSVAVLAKEHGIPFYVAAPLSTIDLACPDGDRIPIDERDPLEVTETFGTRTAPDGVGVLNPAFDVTPARYVARHHRRDPRGLRGSLLPENARVSAMAKILAVGTSCGQTAAAVVESLSITRPSSPHAGRHPPSMAASCWARFAPPPRVIGRW